jgi:putative Mn2+ efflux pump MntP
VNFITDPNSARLAEGILYANAKSGNFIQMITFGYAPVQALNVVSAGYSIYVSTSAQAVAVVNVTSAYCPFGRMIGNKGVGIFGNVNSGAVGTAFVDFGVLQANPTTGSIHQSPIV